MWEYGMMEYGGWMVFWWFGGLLVFGAVIYAAVRLGTHHARSADRDYYDCSSHPRDCHGDDRRYYREDDR